MVTTITEVLAAGIVVMAVLTAVVRGRRHRLVRRRLEAEALARPLLLQALDGDPSPSDGSSGSPDGSGPSSGSSRVQLDQRVAPYLDALAVGLAAKLRGGDRAALVSLLESRGTLARARSRTRSASARARLEAVELLGGLGDTSAVVHLVARLSDPDGEVRRSAVRALGRTASPEAVPALLALLDARGVTYGDRANGVPPHYITLALLRIGSSGAGSLESALTSHGPNGRAAAAAVLGWLGETSSVSALTSALDDPAAAVRAAAVEALGRIGLPTAMSRMCELLDQAQPEPVRVAAAAALGRLGDERAAGALGTALDSPHLVTRTVAQALSRLGGAGEAQLADRCDVPEAREVLA